MGHPVYPVTQSSEDLEQIEAIFLEVLTVFL